MNWLFCLCHILLWGEVGDLMMVQLDVKFKPCLILLQTAKLLSWILLGTLVPF